MNPHLIVTATVQGRCVELVAVNGYSTRTEYGSPAEAQAAVDELAELWSRLTAAK